MQRDLDVDIMEMTVVPSGANVYGTKLLRSVRRCDDATGPGDGDRVLAAAGHGATICPFLPPVISLAPTI